MRRVVLGLAATLAVSNGAAAQAIDPLVLPSAGAERTYACASYLNAFSAMMKARDADDEQGKTLQLLFLVMSVESEAEGGREGSASEVRGRMNAWDAAVIDAALTRGDAHEQLQANLVDCIEAAVEVAARP